MKDIKHLLLLLSIFLISCNRDKEFNKLAITSSIKIEETSDYLISSLVQADFLSDQEVLILSSRTDVLTLNTKTGKLTPFINVDIDMASMLHSFLKNKFPEFTFLNDSLTETNYTLMIGGFQITDNDLFLSITTQFPVLGDFEGLSASIFMFFNFILKYNLNTREMKNQYLLPEVDMRTDFTAEDKDEPGSFVSPRFGFFINSKDSQMFSKTNASPINDSSSFLVKYDLNEVISKKQFVPLFHDLDKQSRRDYSFTKASFFQLNNTLYCSNGKDLFEIQPNERLTKKLINNKFYNIQNFQVLNNGDVLYMKGCDTTKSYSSVHLLSEQKESELIPDLNTTRLFIFRNGIHAITLQNENYYYETYKAF